jgi:pentose-5-phosphate-3-epimerase
MKVGLILNPETPVEAMKYYIHKADKITVMTVDPGFAGQPFIRRCWKNRRTESLARARGAELRDRDRRLLQ